MSQELEEIRRAEATEEPLSARDFKSLGLYIQAATEWQELARTICDYFKIEKRLRPYVFALCNPNNIGKYRKTIGEIRRLFEDNKHKGPRYFLACFAKNKIKPWEKLNG